MNARMLAAYHEAGHVVAAWLLGIPLGVVEISSDGHGRTQLSSWYCATSMFREVSQNTVRRDVLFVLAGDCGEQLLSRCDGRRTADFDAYLAYVLSRRFRLDLYCLKEEAGQMVVRQRHTNRPF